VPCRPASSSRAFPQIPNSRNDAAVFLYAFDLIELDGDDLRNVPLTVRKTMLANVIAHADPGLRLNEHIEEDGPIVFRHACKLGLEGHTGLLAIYDKAA
jgi:ATP-dependent DNA ligase